MGLAAMGLTAAVAFLGGVAFFFSPCVWPMYPAYVAYLAGEGGGTASAVPAATSGSGAVDGSRAADGSGAGGSCAADGPGAAFSRWPIIRQALGFIIGFSLVFLALGATASLIGQLFLQYQDPFRRVSGLLVVGFGLYMMGLIPSWVLGTEVRPQTRPRGSSFPLAVAMGFAFGFGWTPCVGPILASILLLTSTLDSLGQGVGMLALYSLGLAVPFFLLAVFLDRFRPLWRRIGPWLPWVQRASGALLVVLGIMIFSGSFARLSSWLYYSL